MTPLKPLACPEWERLLESWLADELPAVLGRRMAEHADVCPACREVLAALRVSGESSGEELTAAVLARTSGPACGRACGLLPAHADGELAGPDTELLRAHLAHCADCAAVAEALTWSSSLLPELAELDPGPGFTAAVLSRTSARRRAPASVRGRIAGWWETWQRRPRFALEMAYAATVLLIVLCATPLSPFREAPPRALAAMRTGSVQLAGMGASLETTSIQVTRFGRAVLAEPVATGRELLDEASAEIGQRGERAGAASQDLRTHGVEFGNHVRHGRIRPAGSSLWAMTCDVGQICKSLFT